MHYSSMASSSSSSHKSIQDYKLIKAEEDEQGGDWLELGLGLGFGTAACRKVEEENHHQHRSNDPVSVPLSSSVPLQTNQELGLGLGLGLGLRFDNDDGVCRRVLAPSSFNYHNPLWPDRYHHHHYDHDHDDHHTAMPSWPWHVDDWQMPVPDDTHHHYYSTTRPHSTGFWFTLRSLTNRDGEGVPQIPKAYIRVKDENVTVFMVKKYLVRKLGLSNEAEIDISCMGQKLLHTQSLKQVRDAVWLPRLLESVDSAKSFEDSNDGSTQHLMSLHYSRRCELD